MVKHKGDKKAPNAKGPKGAAAFMHKGKKPPHMGGPFPDQHQGNMPPWTRDRFPDAMWSPEGNMPPWMRGPDYDGMCEPGGPMPPWKRGPFPEERCERGGPFPGDRYGGPMPPDMRGPFPGDRYGGPIHPQMRGPFPDEMGDFRGPVPPPMRGPFPGEKVERRGPLSPPIRGPFPGEMGDPGGNMAARMRGPCSDAMFEQREPVPPQMRGPYPGDRCERNRNVLPQMGRTNSSDPRPCGPLPGEDDLRRPGPSPSIKQKEVGKCAPAYWEKENHSSDQLASAEVGESTTRVQERYVQESAERILESFGLSPEDLEELSSYPEDQLKPENMPEILRTIRMRKMAQQRPSQDIVGGDGFYSPLPGPVGTAQPSTPFVGPSVSQPTTLPTSSEAWKMNKCPTPSMMSDYYGALPRVFPHTCILCKIECKRSTDWLLHLNTATHSESCLQLRQQYPDWNPEDPSFRKRYESDRNANQAQRHQSVSSSPERSRSSHSRLQSQSRSRSPGHGRGSRQRSQSPISPRMSPTDSRTSRQSAAQYVVTDQPHTQSGHHGEPSKDLVQQEQPKDEAASQVQPKTDPQQSVLSSLVEKSVSQAMSLLQPGGTGGGSLIQGVGLPTLPPVQLDPTSLSLGLVSMMQMVATQVVQAVLAAKETSSGQAVASATPTSAVASVMPQPSSSVSSNIEKQENKEEMVPRTISPHAGVRKQGEPKQVLICGHSIIVQARQRAERSGIGSQLGLGSMANIKWLGQSNMSCDQLLPTLTPHLESDPPPDIVVVHLGEDDLGKQTSMSISIKIRAGLARIREKVPGIGIIWSFMLERRAWPSKEDENRFYRARIKINTAVRKTVEAARGASILHSNIMYSSLHLYQEDGVHLSDAGYDVFLENLQQGLIKFIRGKCV